MPRQTKQKLHPAASRAVAVGHVRAARDACRMALDLISQAHSEIRRVKGAGTAMRSVMPTACSLAGLFSRLNTLVDSPSIRIHATEEHAILLDYGLTRREER